MSKCPVCLEEYTTHGCQCLKVGEPVPLGGSITSYEGLEEIKKITVPEVAWAITLTNKLNEIIERINLLSANIVIGASAEPMDGKWELTGKKLWKSTDVRLEEK